MNWLTSRCAPLLALTALALAGCDKGTDLNVDLPDTAAINTEYKDLAVDVATVRIVPVQTLKTDHFLVGRLNDNVAGTTEAKAYFNLLASPYTDSLPSRLAPRTLRLDSVVVVMGFDKVYGSATTPARFDVFKLLDPLDERQVYDGGSSVPLGAPIGQNLTSRLDRTQVVTVPANTTANTPAYTTTVPDQTVRLLVQRRAFPAVAPTPRHAGYPAIAGVPSAFADDFFNRLSQPSFGQPQLDAALKGLAVTASPGHTSSVVSFGQGRETRMVVYFHAIGTDTLRRSYSVAFGSSNRTSGGANPSDPRYFTQILSTLPPALAPLAAGAGAVPPALLGGTSYLQEGVGLGTRVTFQGLDDLIKTPGLTVNRAELRVPVKPFSNALLANPAQLYAVEVDANNNVLQRVVNYQSYDRVAQADGRSQLGVQAPAVGSITDLATAQPYYSLLITSYLQAYLNNQLGDNPASLVLVPNIRNSSALTLNRAALDASNIRLRVYYSKR